MSGLSKYFPSDSRILIDGGLGSTLEDVFHIDTASSLWSSEALIKNPESVIQAHLLFLRAGARLIETASYQGSFSTYAKAGYSLDDAIKLMRSSVALAAEARRRFAAESHVPTDSIKIALSLAAYGASLPLPHEFDGFYPPPYGPQAYVHHSTNDPSALPNRNAFRADERAQEAQSEAALAAFHLERLRAYATDAQTWRSIDVLAFETIPLAREVRAIRRAVAALEDDGLAPEERKPWWVCAVYTGGEFPEQRLCGDGGEQLSARDVLTAYFGDIDVHSTAGGGGESARYAVPHAFGVNCTAVAHVAKAVAAVSDALEETGAGGRKPWLVLKPNGGQTYDMDTCKWGWYGGEVHTQGDEWAGKLGDIVRAATNKGVWGGILVGGCCKTGDDELRALAKVLD
ncbi:Homocysteine S-methyltransferase [Lactarius quietus]|nr:Homocysteine S-methyltransferase [Lactarius quietus]